MTELDGPWFCGAKISARDEAGYSPLILALDHKRHEMAKEVIAARANTSVLSADGDTAITPAKQDRNAETSELLQISIKTPEN